MILLLDNRDSFTFNLVQALRVLGAEVRVERSTALDLDAIRSLSPDRILIGPGPGGPSGAGCSLQVARERPAGVPILGVCLGLQVIAEAHGASIRRAAEPVHGHAERIEHDGLGLFEGLPQPLMVARYHSLLVHEPSLPPELEVSARSKAGEVMALRHRSLPMEAVQFHPESFLSEGCGRLLVNFLNLGG